MTEWRTCMDPKDEQLNYSNYWSRAQCGRVAAETDEASQLGSLGTQEQELERVHRGLGDR